jgi:hypothetical protein
MCRRIRRRAPAIWLGRSPNAISVPPIRLPVGFGQTRTASQLPVLTMITGYARWASGLLVPMRRAEDLYAGWWWLIQQLGALPRVLVWDGEAKA